MAGRRKLVEHTIRKSFDVDENSLINAVFDVGEFTVLAGDYEEVVLELTHRIASDDEDVIKHVLRKHKLEHRVCEKENALTLTASPVTCVSRFG